MKRIIEALILLMLFAIVVLAFGCTESYTYIEKTTERTQIIITPADSMINPLIELAEPIKKPAY